MSNLSKPQTMSKKRYSIEVQTDEETGKKFKRMKNGQRRFVCEHGRCPTQCKEGECIKKYKFKNKATEPCPCGSGKALRCCRAGCGTPGAGSMYCNKTGKVKPICPCGDDKCGASLCECGRERRQCPKCDPLGHLIALIRNRSREALKSKNVKKSKKTCDYLGISYSKYYSYIEKWFQPGMTWENFGKGKDKWNIGHAKPLLQKGITREETEKRLHYSNTFPQWEVHNVEQGNRYNFTDYGPLAI